MATILNNRSTIATDPIRNFRFLVTFIPHTVGITKKSDGSNGLEAGQDWANELKSITFGFTSVSGMAVTTDAIPYREGGYNTTVHQIPGQTSFAPISLQRGVVLGSSQNWAWMRELFQTVQGSTTRTASDNFRCDLEIQVLSHPAASLNTTTNGANAGEEDHVAIRFKVYNAWITSLAYSDLNAGDNAIFVEQMSLVHEGFDVSFAKDLTTSAKSLA